MQATEVKWMRKLVKTAASNQSPQHIMKQWHSGYQNWNRLLNQLEIKFADRKVGCPPLSLVFPSMLASFLDFIEKRLHKIFCPTLSYKFLHIAVFHCGINATGSENNLGAGYINIWTLRTSTFYI